MTDLVPVRRALISLSDKSGLDELAAGLARHGIEIVSTGGTAAKLRETGAAVRDIVGIERPLELRQPPDQLLPQVAVHAAPDEPRAPQLAPVPPDAA